jgi:uncharacterized protein YggT (Ycf19 family)
MNTQVQPPDGPPIAGRGTRTPAVAEPRRTATYSYRAVSVIWLIGGVVAAVLGIRFAFELLGASQEATFTSFMYSITAPLVAPFQGIFPSPARHGYVFDGAALLAIVIYLLVTWGVVALVRIASTSRGARTPVD